ncbi:hypothetical protein Y049_429 [Burkholderia pseudomallei MSHR684]|nr:hypothetical protein Y049_429 [Burkholderia pseudomallei MSHR684]
MIVEAPRADSLAHRDHFRRAARVRELGHHAVEARDRLRHGLPLARFIARAQLRAATVDEQRRRARHRPAPDALALDDRIEPERGCAVERRQPEIDRIAEILAREAELQAHGRVAHRARHRHVPREHPAREPFGARPQRRRQPALARERRNHAALRGIREQAQRTIQARLAAAVRPGDHVERSERHDQLAQRAVVGDGECGEGRHREIDGRKAGGRKTAGRIDESTNSADRRIDATAADGANADRGACRPSIGPARRANRSRGAVRVRPAILGDSREFSPFSRYARHAAARRAQCGARGTPASDVVGSAAVNAALLAAGSGARSPRSGSRASASGVVHSVRSRGRQCG